MLVPIDLPLTPEPQAAEPYFVDMGGWQGAEFGGGDAVRVDRLGSRFGLSVQMPPMFWNDPKRQIHARQWIARLLRGTSQGVRMKFPQPNFVPSINSGVVQVAAAAQSAVLQISAPAGAVALEGTMCSVRKADGRRFLHQLQFDVNEAGGRLYLSLSPRLRASIEVGDEVWFNPVTIDGAVSGDRRTWSLEMARTVGLSFEIVEVG